jgi:polo-like kinase 1
MELVKRRKTLTEPEARFYMAQILDACDFMHRSNVIHRDLKLGNLFLGEDLQIKVGDFGLATTITFDGERKKYV